MRVQSSTHLHACIYPLTYTRALIHSPKRAHSSIHLDECAIIHSPRRAHSSPHLHARTHPFTYTRAFIHSPRRVHSSSHLHACTHPLTYTRACIPSPTRARAYPMSLQAAKKAVTEDKVLDQLLEADSSILVCSHANTYTEHECGQKIHIHVGRPEDIQV